MTVLYADDDRDDQELISEAFNKIDPTIACQTVNSGNEVLDFLNVATEMPDFIFLDVNMPMMNGTECLVNLKRDNRFRNIPVVMYSTTCNQDEIRNFYSLGASSFIRKPNNFNDLCSTLNTFIKLIG